MEWDAVVFRPAVQQMLPWWSIERKRWDEFCFMFSSNLTRCKYNSPCVSARVVTEEIYGSIARERGSIWQIVYLLSLMVEQQPTVLVVARRALDTCDMCNEELWRQTNFQQGLHLGFIISSVLSPCNNSKSCRGMDIETTLQVIAPQWIIDYGRPFSKSE